MTLLLKKITNAVEDTNQIILYFKFIFQIKKQNVELFCKITLFLDSCAIL